MIDYSKGRHEVLTPQGNIFGVIDGDEFVRSGSNLVFRIDGDEIYSLDGKHLGYIEDGVARSFNNEVIFKIIS